MEPGQIEIPFIQKRPILEANELTLLSEYVLFNPMRKDIPKSANPSPIKAVSFKVRNSLFSNSIFRKGKHEYKFNTVLGSDATQKDVFEKCQVHEMIDSAMDGYSATIFAYG